MQAIFLKATDSGWYPEFLKSVVESITANVEGKRILDIGTGPGTLPQMLIKKNSDLDIIGIDINTAMIDEAQRRLFHKNVSYKHEKINAPLEFDDKQFDVITFCSVLFLLNDSTRTNLMNEALRVLKPKGKIIILTPSGSKSIFASFIEVWRYPFSFNNFTFMVWKTATGNSARKWQNQKWLSQFSEEKNLKYTSSLTFNDNATIETISK